MARNCPRDLLAWIFSPYVEVIDLVIVIDSLLSEVIMAACGEAELLVVRALLASSVRCRPSVWSCESLSRPSQLMIDATF